MTSTITNSELERYDSEYEISVCKVLPSGGYQVTYADKPEPKPSLPVPAIKVPEINPQTQEQVIKTVVCIDCGTEHDANKECWICAPLARAAQAFRKNKRDYAIQKSAEREGLC